MWLSASSHSSDSSPAKTTKNHSQSDHVHVDNELLVPSADKHIVSRQLNALQQAMSKRLEVYI